MLRDAAQDGEHPIGLAAIRFVLLSGFRRMEGLGVQRPWLDEDEGAIRFPDTKSGAQARVIGQGTVDLLLDQPKTKSPFFFPADWGDGHFYRRRPRARPYLRTRQARRRHAAHAAPQLRKPRRRSRLLRADHRRALGHAPRGITQRCVQIDEALRMAADRVAEEMADIVNGKATIVRPRKHGGRRSKESQEADERALQTAS